MQKKKEIIRKCITGLEQIFQTLGKEVKIEYNQKNERVCIHTDNGILDFPIEVKTVLKRPLPDHLKVQKSANAEPILVMAEYINPSIAEDLIDQRFNYIDCQGNAHIYDQGKVLIHIQGKILRKEPERETTALFQPKGMQVLFVLLSDENRINDTIRNLARKSAVSVGRTVSVLKELKNKGYVRRIAGNRQRLIQRNELFESWLSNYGDRLRPSLVLGTYKIAPSVEHDLPKKMYSVFKGREDAYAVSGSLGANQIVRYYRGKTTEIFVKSEMADTIQKTLRLIPSQEPNVTLFNLFSPLIVFEKEGEISIAHPLFLYAELMYQGGDRERETAQLIYDQFLWDMVE